MFAFQVYGTVPFDLDERSAEGTRSGFSTNEDAGNLVDLIRYIGQSLGAKAQRPEPVFDIYAEQSDPFACIDHQRQEISYRKGQSSDARTLLIPKTVRDDHDDRKCGFLLIITSDSFKQGNQVEGVEPDRGGPLWVHFDRHFPNANSITLDERLEVDPKCAAWMGQTVEDMAVLPQICDASFQKIRDVRPEIGLERDLSCIYVQSYKNKASGQSIEAYCDVALDKNEGFYEEFGQISQQAQVTLNTMAQRLPSERFSVNRDHGHIALSNHDTTADPDLRYVVYIPFLQRGCPGDMHEQSARAFTSAVLSHLTGDKTVIFEFREPPSYSTMAILQDCRAYLLSKTPDYIGAKVEVPACEDIFDTFSGRLHPNSPSEDSISNVPSFACTPYKDICRYSRPTRV